MRSRAEARIARAQSCLLAVTAAGAVVWSDAEQWDRPALILLLLTLALATDRLSVGVGDFRVSMVDAGIGAAAVLAGPAPGVLIAIVVMAVDAVDSRLPLHRTLTNMASYAVAALAAGMIVQGAVDGGLATPGESSYILAVTVAMAAFKALNLTLAIAARSFTGFSARDQFDRTVIPLVPWEAVSVGMLAGAAHAYVTVGIEAILGFIVVLFFFRVLLDNIAAAEQRQLEIAHIAADRDRYLQEALAAEERERRRIASELHDDALQVLLGARADLVEGLSGQEDRLVDARDAVAAAVGKLRDLMVRLGPGPEAEGPIGDGVRDLAKKLGRRAGFDAYVAVDEELSGTSDPLVLGVVRELLTNVAKHARATRVDVRVEETPTAIRIEIRDDGVGFDRVDRAEALADGHVGLALLEQRISARSGALDIRSRPEGGTVASVVLAPTPKPRAGAARSA